VLGFVTGQTQGDDFLAALHAVREGNPYLPPQVADQFIEGLRELS
jgi:DNA-binding NarL/FixJ family response regulator